MWLINVIAIVVLYFVYVYLKQLHTCNCVNNTYASRLKTLEAILLGFNAIIVGFAIFSKINGLGALVKLKEHIFKILMIGGILMLIYYGFFVYNGYEFWKSVQANCKCADGWQKYVVYVQTLLAGIILLLTFILSGFAVFKRMTNSSSTASANAFGAAISNKKRSRKTKA